MASYTKKKATQDALVALRDLYLYTKMGQQLQTVLKDSKIRSISEEMIGEDGRRAMSDLFAKQNYFISKLDEIFKKNKTSAPFLGDNGAPGFSYLDEVALQAIEAVNEAIKPRE